MKRTVVAVIVVVAVVALGSTTSGRRWLEDRADTIRWFINEVRTLQPTVGPR
jgi:hypothetical protein